VQQNEQQDWLMIEEYAKKKSIFGCILCEKTHKKEHCEYKAKRTAEQPPQQQQSTQYSWYD
jgi:hypothetical protein